MVKWLIKTLGHTSNIKMYVPFDLEILLTGTYHKKIITNVYKDE